MKQYILVSLMVCSNINFCPFEGPAYMGMHLGKDSDLSKTNIATQHRDDEIQQQKDSWRDRLQFHWNNLKQKVTKFFVRDSNQPKGSPGSDTATKQDQFGDDSNSDDDSSRQAIQAQHDIIQEERLRSISDDTFPYNPLQEYPRLEEIQRIPSLSSKQIAVMNFSHFNFADFSAETLEILLNNHQVLLKLSQQQVQAMNPQELSIALKNKLKQPLLPEFVQDLSDAQVATLIGDHVEWRSDNWWKNWGTKFQQNFTPEDLEILKQRKNTIDALDLVKNLFTQTKVFITADEQNKLKKLVKNLNQNDRNEIFTAFENTQNKQPWSNIINMDPRVINSNRSKMQSILGITPQQRD